VNALHDPRHILSQFAFAHQMIVIVQYDPMVQSPFILLEILVHLLQQQLLDFDGFEQAAFFINGSGDKAERIIQKQIRTFCKPGLGKNANF